MHREEFDAYLNEISEALRFGRRYRSEVRAELEDHIETQLEALLEAGVSHDEAVTQVLEDFGSAGVLAKRFGRIGQGRRWIMRSTLAISLVVLATVATSWLMPSQPGNPLAPSRTSALSHGQPGETAGDASTTINIARPENEDDDRIRQALEKRLDVDFRGMGLSDALDHIRNTAGVNLFVNWAVLENAGVERDATLDVLLSDAKFFTVLNVVLESAGAGEAVLAYAVRDGLLNITTDYALGGQTETRLYDCEDLVRAELTAGQRRELERVMILLKGNLFANNVESVERLMKELEQLISARRTDELISAIQNTVEPESWRAAGGNVGSISVFDRTLVIVQTEMNHRAIEALIEGLAGMKAGSQMAKR